MNTKSIQRRRILVTFSAILAFLLAGGLLSACSSLLPTGVSTPLPAEFIPTAAALTLAARDAGLPAPTSTSISATAPVAASPTPKRASPSQTPQWTATVPSNTPTPGPASPTPQAPPSETSAPETAITGTSTPQPGAGAATPTHLPTATPTTPPSATSTYDWSQGTPTFTPAPPIPDARIQIYRLGDLSKVASPLDVSLRLTCGDAKLVRIELFGEDGRLLARYVREYNSTGWEAARIGISMEFEIGSAAELGRLVVSAEDAFGRVIEANSMKLVLMSQGLTELNPSTGLQQAIVIEDPQELALIQDGRLIVTGRAHPETDQPLRVMLISEDGRVLGQRLAGVTVPLPGGYGTYIAEVPYEVQDVTPALLVVYEEGKPISEVTYLTSIHVILAP